MGCDGKTFNKFKLVAVCKNPKLQVGSQNSSSISEFLNAISSKKISQDTIRRKDFHPSITFYKIENKAPIFNYTPLKTGNDWADGKRGLVVMKYNALYSRNRIIVLFVGGGRAYCLLSLFVVMEGGLC
jgi:hypothetical protein